MTSLLSLSNHAASFPVNLSAAQHVVAQCGTTLKEHNSKIGTARIL